MEKEIDEFPNACIMVNTRLMSQKLSTVLPETTSRKTETFILPE